MRERLAGRMAPAALDVVEALIMATKTHHPGVHPDAPYLIDIDLAILGAEPADFDAYDAAIRKEYAHVPDDAYRAGRTRVLQSFLDRERIIHDGGVRSSRDARPRQSRAGHRAAVKLRPCCRKAASGYRP